MTSRPAGRTADFDEHRNVTQLCRRWLEQHEAAGVDEIPYSATLEIDGKDYLLGRRLSYARARRRQGKLDDAIAELYEALPGWSWQAPRIPHGRERYAASVVPERARQWMQLHGVDRSDKIPHSATLEIDGKPYGLGRALARARLRYGSELLTQDEIKAFEQLPSWTWLPPQRAPRKNRPITTAHSS